MFSSYKGAAVIGKGRGCGSDKSEQLTLMREGLILCWTLRCDFLVKNWGEKGQAFVRKENNTFIDIFNLLFNLPLPPSGLEHNSKWTLN